MVFLTVRKQFHNVFNLLLLALKIKTRKREKTNEKIYPKTAYSNGKYDTNQVIERITVKDKWNNGPKTKAYYNFATGIVDGSVGSFPENEEVFYGGGLLVEGKVIEEGISFNK
ncbi:hypothetical protein QP555_07060 [Peptoniphilus lacrimalis]|nr:hypothetical protein [Peptoniphilus lacrimalis]MDK7732248.1 hypothetical protein [Peptoniphilus lacrimalis]